MRKLKVSVITLLVRFKFLVGIFINHCLGNMLKTKKTDKKDNNQSSMVEKYFFVYKKEMV